MVIEDGRMIRLLSTDREELIIPPDVTAVGARAAYEHSELRRLSVSPNTKTIGRQAFAFCRQLESAELPDGVRRLDDGCFQGCVSLRAISLPDTVISLHSCVFKGCASLASVRLSRNLRRNIEGEAFAGCIALERLVLPPAVQQIRAGAFAHCASLRQVFFQNPDLIIEENAFPDCPSLAEPVRAFIETHLWRRGTVDINSRAAGPAGRLSNYTARSFVLDGIPCRSIEGVLQSLKAADPEAQRRICLLTGGEASGAGKALDWKTDQLLYWQGHAYERRSEAYGRLLDHIYDAVFAQDAAFRADLAALKGKEIDHRMGLSDPSETVLTRLEFLRQLRRLMENLPDP